MAEIKTLIRKRGSVKARLTSFNNYLESRKNKFLSKIELIELKERTKRAESLLSEFSDVHGQMLEVAEDSDIKEYEDQRESFESDLFRICATARSILNSQESDSLDQSVTNSVDRSFHTSEANNVKLPTLKLPEFDGSFERWLGFFDTFKTVIHDNNSLSKVQKFHYLNSCLVGDAAQVIRGLEISQSSYQAAWDLLQKRYQNSGLMVHNHIKCIVESPKIQRPSFYSLRCLLNTMQTHIRALQALHQPVDSWGSLLIYIITDKFDTSTKKEWEKLGVNRENLPTVAELTDFLESQCHFLEKMDKSFSGPSRQTSEKVATKKATFSSTTTKPSSCPVCNQQHALFACDSFLKLSTNNRFTEVKRLNRCINCLKTGHTVSACQSKGCRKCGKMHNTLLHLPKDVEDSKGPTSVTATQVNSELQTFNLLPTAIVDVLDEMGNAHECTVLLDSGSQSNFLTTGLCEKLKLRTTKINLNVIGINQFESTISLKTEATIKSKHSDLQARLQFLVTPHITSQLPSEFINIHSLKIPKGIKLADPRFNTPKQIDMLVGVDFFWDIFCHEESISPFIHSTRLGYIISGRTPLRQRSQRSTSCNYSVLSEQLKKFWQIEECPKQEHFSIEEKACERSFINTTKRNEEGRFVVSIPFKASLDSLGDSSEQAKKRFETMERKLQRNESLKERYVKFMQEYLDMGHMTKVGENQPSNHTCYLPHHGVLKEDSLTTKLRVVFDGSAATTTGVSINDIQMVGPTIQQDLLSILLRHRLHPYAVGADISMMFRQILVSPEQRPLQRIFWRFDPSEPLEAYDLNTVTYGLASSSFLAIRCLFQLADENEKEFPKAAEIIRKNMYVDDLLYGASSIEEATTIQKEVSSILASAGFILRKWISNEPSILNEIQHPDQNDKCQILRLGENDIAKTLGLAWSCSTDELVYDINSDYSFDVHTKRSILSTIARIYDPLGLLGPFVIKAKIILQKLWLCKSSWDDPLPDTLNSEWEIFLKNIASIKPFRVPRQVCCKSPIRVEIHAFSDASEDAYGACAYLRSISLTGYIFVHLLTAKSRVAPLKCKKKSKRESSEPITIPKLELSAAQLSAKLVDKIKSSIDISIDDIFYWCDSTIVLGWLQKEPYALKTFVSNRVFEIQSLTSISKWHHVSSRDNPADCLSRGTYTQFLESLWLNGPKWLSMPTFQMRSFEPEENLPELKGPCKAVALSNSSVEFIRVESYSNLSKLERVMAYCLRFIKNLRSSKDEHESKNLSSKEIREAHVQLIKLSQKQSFSEEIKNISENRDPKKGSKLFRLNPFIHDDGTLRMRGRLENSDYTFCKRHPFILDSKHHLTRLIFEREHLRLLHVGPHALLSQLREEYWPISGRNLARKIVNECVTCFKIKPKSVSPLMGNLPHDRVTPTPAFYVTGIDYAGPYTIKDRKGRGAKTSKCYIALFVCFATKAIHLELVTDLTSECFILALRRFASRWGMPGTLYSDNGSTFIGARNELRELGKYINSNQSTLHERFVGERFNWHFIPAYSPHFGGIWEAGVKSTKHHLRRIMKNTILTFEEFYRLLAQISGILNSRPLTPLSSSPLDLNPLTPAHFLIGRRMTTVPDPDVTHIPVSRTSRYQMIQQLQQNFWKRWSKEFISELQIRTNWSEMQDSLQIGELVLIKDDNLPPMKWSLGRVIELHPGVDSIARVATIKTLKGQIRRNFHKLCRLPMEASASTKTNSENIGETSTPELK